MRVRNLSLIVALLIGSAHPASAGDARMITIIRAPAAGAAVHLKRSESSKITARVKNGSNLLLLPDCRDAKGQRIVDRFGPEFGKAGGSPKAIQNLWCSVFDPVDRKTVGWVRGKHVSAAPL